MTRITTTRGTVRALLFMAIHSLWTASGSQAATINSLFDPADYAALGHLTVNSGTITINTDTLTFSAPGASFSGSGVTAQSQSGNVELAVFTFNSLDIGAGVTNVHVTGSRGLAILSQSNLTLNSNVTGMSGANSVTPPPSTGAGRARRRRWRAKYFVPQQSAGRQRRQWR